MDESAKDRGRASRVGINIGAVRSEVQNLADLAPEWNGLFPDEQTDFEIDWSDAMARFRNVEEARVSGDLTAAQEREWATIRRRVASLLPTIERLDLARPGVPIG